MTRARVLGALATVLLAASAGAAAPPVLADPVEIGVLVPMEGPYAEIGRDIADGLDLAFGESGYVAAGREIVPVYKDTRARPDVGLERAEELIAGRVDFMAGVVSSDVAYAIRDPVAASGIPLLVTVSTADGLTQEIAAPNIFRTTSSASQNGHPLGEWLHENGYRRLALIGPDYAMGYEATGGVAHTFTEAGGEVVAAVWVPLGTTDFGPYLEAAREAEPDAVVATFAGRSARAFLEAFAVSPLRDSVQLVDTGILTDCTTLMALPDPAIARGIVSATHYRNCLDIPKNRSFVDAYRTRFGRAPSLFAESSYVAGRLIVEAIESLGGDLSSPEAVVEAIRTADVSAPRGPFVFDDFNNPIHTVYLTRITIDGYTFVPAFRRYENVSQFWHWSPEGHITMPNYADLSNYWVQLPHAKAVSLPPATTMRR